MVDKRFIEEEIVDVWLDPNEPEDEVNRRFARINSHNAVLYDFILTYYNYFITRHDYGYGHRFTMIEGHVLIDIIDHPGITVSQLAEAWGRTRSAISQTVKKLIKWNYIERVMNEDDSKVFFLHATEKAQSFSLIHKRYDNLDTIKLNKRLLKKFSVDEVRAFYAVLEEFNQLVKISREKEKPRHLKK